LGAINDQHGPTVHDIDVGLPSEQIFEYSETAMSAALMVTSIALRLPQAPHRQPVCPLLARTARRAISPPPVFVPALAIFAIIRGALPPIAAHWLLLTAVPVVLTVGQTPSVRAGGRVPSQRAA